MPCGLSWRSEGSCSGRAVLQNAKVIAQKASKKAQITNRAGMRGSHLEAAIKHRPDLSMRLGMQAAAAIAMGHKADLEYHTHSYDGTESESKHQRSAQAAQHCRSIT